MLTSGSVRGWGPQGPVGATPGPMMGQGVRPGRMVHNMNAALPRGGGPPGSRVMVNMQMMGNGERKQTGDKQTDAWLTWSLLSLFSAFVPSDMDISNPTYPQQHVPPNQTAPWPDRMMMDHYGNQSRYDAPVALPL